MPTTTQRGLGAAHQGIRRQKLRELAADPGQPCWRCGIPMFATLTEAAAAGLPRKLWHVDLDDYPGRALGGPQVKILAHRHCNRKAGAAFINRRRAASARILAGYNRW